MIMSLTGVYNAAHKMMPVPRHLPAEEKLYKKKKLNLELATGCECEYLYSSVSGRQWVDSLEGFAPRLDNSNKPQVLSAGVETRFGKRKKYNCT